MKVHTYQQYCPIAHALDSVGDRWSLLIVRNLLLGPKRFTDLLRGLPGIGTNILTDRLKKLEANRVVCQRQLPPPAPSLVYELTPSGQGLRPVLAALAFWGGQTLGERQATQVVPLDALMLPIRHWFADLLHADEQGDASRWESTYEVVCPDLSDSQGFLITMQVGQVAITPAAHVREPQENNVPLLRLQASAATWYDLAAGRMGGVEAIASGHLIITGDARQQSRLLAAAARSVPDATREGGHAAVDEAVSAGFPRAERD